MLSLILCTIALRQDRTVWVENLDLSGSSQDWGSPERARSVDGTPITLNHRKFDHGLGTHANSLFSIDLHGNAVKFTTWVGIDDETQGKGAVRFKLAVDGRLVADSGVMHGNDAAKELDADLTGGHRLDLISQAGANGIDFDHADWADAQITVKASGPLPQGMTTPAEPAMQIYMDNPPRPEINGARVVGCTPGRPFLFKIPVSGQEPFVFSADGLPSGVSLDSATGIISGAVTDDGTYDVHLMVKGPAGTDRRNLKIVAGDHKLALTPPMGWNSWNVWGTTVTADKVKAAADEFVQQRLVDYGYRSVNIDDAWEGKRDADGSIQTNQKFGDMGALANYVHSKGILLGIYSSPGPKTCAGYEATYKHEQQDADSYAKWGIDYLKYDWCSYGSIAPPNPTIADYQAPYALMRKCLDNCGRDIIFSFCQYGMGDVWNWGKEIGGNLWRTTGDITDTFSSMTHIAFAQGDPAHVNGAGPGGWNDPDMLVVGNLGWGDHPHPTRLKPNEQIMHITMWSLLAAPLLLGCDLTHLDPWTKALITNHDVIEIDQDPLGRPAHPVYSTAGGIEVWSRPLWDGTLAVGFMNRDFYHQKISVSWDQLGISGPQPVRNLWLRRNMGMRDHELSADVPGHGAILFKIGRPDKS